MKITTILKESDTIKIVQYSEELQNEYDELIEKYQQLSLEQQKAAISKFGACLLIDANSEHNVSEQLIEFALNHTHILYQGSIRVFDNEHDYGITIIALLGHHIKSSNLKNYIWKRFGADAAIWVGGSPIELMKQVLSTNRTHDISLMVRAYADSGDPVPQEMITPILTHPNVIIHDNVYNNMVHNMFKGNNLLINKWIRYGEKVRNENN
jgi:hypothetical protein